MKKKTIFLMAIMLTLAPMAQQNYTIGTSYNSITVTLNTNSTNETIKIFEDTLIFKEDFSKIRDNPYVSQYIDNHMFNAANPVNIANSYTLYNDCKARFIYINNDTNIALNPNGEFITPPINLTTSHKIKYSIIPGKKSSKIYLRAINNNNIIKLDSIKSFAKAGVKKYLTFSPTESYNNTRIGLLNGTKGTNSEIILDYIEITTTPNPIELTTNNNIYTANNLKENTKYYIVIGTDTITYTTPKKIEITGINNITRTTATVNFYDSTNSSTKKLLIKKLTDNNIKIADDLFISKHISNSSTNNNAIEIFNDTGTDIYLKDYKIKIQRRQFTNGISYGNIDNFSFSNDDTIKNNSCIIIADKISSYNQTNNSKVYNFISLSNLGNAGVALLHNNDTIDLFGNFLKTDSTLGGTSHNGWIYTNGSDTIQTNNIMLYRKTDIIMGVKSNPHIGFATLCDWNQYACNSTNLSNLGTHSINNGMNETNQDNTVIAYEDVIGESYNLTNLEPNTVYQAMLILKDTTSNDSTISNIVNFRTDRKVTTRTNDGYWADNNWDNGVPGIEDIAKTNGYNVTIADTTNAECYELYLQDKDSTRTKLENKGTLKVANLTRVQCKIKGYKNNKNNWYIIGNPVVSDSNMLIKTFNIQDGDSNDLYYYSESHIQDSNGTSRTGWWINYKSDNNKSTFFADNNQGYLFAYKNDTTLTFKGLINDSASYTLLKNASLTTGDYYNGYHLTYNKLPESINNDNITRNACTNPMIYNRQTGNYQQLDENISILPYEGFITQVTSANNSFIISKTSNNIANKNIKANNSTNWLTMKISNQDGWDKTFVAFENDKTDELDWQTDNYKIFGMGYSPEIYTVFNEKIFTANSVNKFNDSILIQLGIIIKKEDNYKISYNYNNEDIYHCFLIDNETNTAINDFVSNPEYSFNADTNFNKNKYSLEIIKNTQSLKDITQNNSDITMYQNKDKLEFFSCEKIKNIVVYSTAMDCLQSTNKSKITLKNKGLSFVKVSTANQSKIFKVIYL